MSSSVPYIAPWQTGFERYSTQLIRALPTTNPARITWTVPDGQWYRIVFISGQLATGAGATARTLSLVISNPTNTGSFVEGATAPQKANYGGTLAWMPGGAAYFSDDGVNQLVMTMPLPDVLWGPGSTIEFRVANFVAGQDGMTFWTLATEIYTEDRPGVFAPATPTPTMV